jgi:thioredoxin reductase (NADPH)
MYDVVIIGGGPAGLTAAVYCARYKLKTIVFSKNIGGLASTADKICNFPSYIEIKGYELMKKFTKQVENLNVSIVYDEVKEILKKKDLFEIVTESKKYFSKKIILSTGTQRKRLNVKGEGIFYGKGISYCATCDATFFKNKKVAVIGGNDAALTSALLLSEYATKVYIIYRKEKFVNAEPTWTDLVLKEEKIEILYNEEVIEIIGTMYIKKIKLKSNKELEVEGVFIEVGSVPETKLAKDLGINLDSNYYIIVDKYQKTNIKGIYAAGDSTSNSLKQIVTASSEGAIAAYNLFKEIKQESLKK